MTPHDSFRFDAMCQAMVNKLTLTPLALNPTSYHHGGHSALQSLVHVLVMPKQRIFNAVTLQRRHVPLIKHMRRLESRAV